MMTTSEILLMWANGASMQEVLDAYAHQLAEKQRAWAETFGDGPTAQGIRSIIHEGANMIDPKVENGSESD